MGKQAGSRDFGGKIKRGARILVCKEEFRV